MQFSYSENWKRLEENILVQAQAFKMSDFNNINPQCPHKSNLREARPRAFTLMIKPACLYKIFIYLEIRWLRICHNPKQWPTNIVVFHYTLLFASNFFMVVQQFLIKTHLKNPGSELAWFNRSVNKTLIPPADTKQLDTRTKYF